MKSLIEFINEAIVNEVSHGLAQRAWKKASGAQKNRIEKLYKELYGKDVSKGDTSHIRFNIPEDEQRSEVTYNVDESDLARMFSYFDQDVLDKIKEVTLSSKGDEVVYIAVKINGKTYYAETDWSGAYQDDYGQMSCELTDTNIESMKKDFDGDGEYLLSTIIYYIGQDLEK